MLLVKVMLDLTLVPSATTPPHFPQVPLPTRVTPSMAPLVTLPAASRWVPVRPTSQLAGIVVVQDTRPGEPVEYATVGATPGAAAAGAAAGAGAAAPAATQEQEPAPPEPFGEHGSADK